MFPTMFRIIWQSCFRGDEFNKSTPHGCWTLDFFASDIKLQAIYKDIDLEGISICICQICLWIKSRLTKRKTSLTVEEKVMIALRLFASGSHLQVVGDTMGHDKATLARVIRQVTDALVQMKDTFIKWPQTPE